jgi:hypothetical protein
MAYEQKEGSGALFRNDKGDNPARPDYRGDVMLGGVLYEVSGWIKPLPSSPDTRFMSLAAKPKQAQQAPKQKAPARPSSGFDDMSDDVPW